MKNLTRSGLGITVKQAKPILEDEEDILWSKGLLGDSDPKTLVNTLVFLFGKYFALRSGEEHRSLSLAQLEVVKGDETECSRLRYSSVEDCSIDESNPKLSNSTRIFLIQKGV